MDAFGAYQLFSAMKLHFQKGSYDWFKYNGRTNLKKENFETRNDKYFFHKLSKRDGLQFFLAAQFVEKPNMWVGEMFSQECEERYQDALKRKQSLQYQFKEDLSRYESLDQALVPINGDYPLILKDYKRGEVSKETLIVLNELFKVFEYWSEKLNDRVLYPELRYKFEKYRGFLLIEQWSNLTKEKYNKIVLDMFC